MSKKGMNRRQFLQTSSLAIAGAAVAGSMGGVFDPNQAWAIPTTTLDQHTAMTLAKVCRHLYPHDEIGSAYYAKIVEEFDEKAKADPDFAKLLRNGVASLDAVYQVKWLELSEGYKLEALKSIETTPFFRAVRGAIITGLYNQPLVWRHFGYEGSSWKFGGYLNRGFNDIGWLPEE
jgi:hypothetical protein